MFSESWWIGTKEENPEEARLDFPKELAQVDTFHLFLHFLFKTMVATEMFNMIRRILWFQAENTEFDFQGGAGGAASVKKLASPEIGSQPTETDSPEVDNEDVLSEDGEFLDDKIQVTPPVQLTPPVQVTPVRQSQRNSGKKFKYDPFNFFTKLKHIRSDDTFGF